MKQGTQVALFKLKHKKDGLYYSTRAGGISKPWSTGGRFYTKQNLGNILKSVRKQCDLECWVAHKIE